MIEVASKEKQLKTLEDIIQHSSGRAEFHGSRMRAHWFEMSKALWKIREGKLHSQQTFEQYCLQRWNWKRTYALGLCRDYEKLKDSKKSVIADIPSESAAAAVADVPEEQREEVLEEAKKSGKVTAKSVKAAAKKKGAAKSKSKPESPKDKSGYPIPERLWPLWNRRAEVKQKIRPLHELKQWVTDMQGTDDLLYNVRGFNLNKMVLEIEKLIFHFQQALPDVVCTKCQGVDPKCDFCKGRGMISTHLARGVTPIEMKEMRDKLTDDSAERLSSASR